MGCSGSKATKVVQPTPVAYEAPKSFLQLQQEAKEVHISPEKDEMSTMSTVSSPYKSPVKALKPLKI